MAAEYKDWLDSKGEYSKPDTDVEHKVVDGAAGKRWLIKMRGKVFEAIRGELIEVPETDWTENS